jgi:hypothetical protein
MSNRNNRRLGHIPAEIRQKWRRDRQLRKGYIAHRDARRKTAEKFLPLQVEVLKKIKRLDD